MPLIENSSYKPAFLFKNKHINTIWPALFRKINAFSYRRERLELEDGDFLDLDWSKIGSKTLVILMHGLEGDSHRPYIKGMVSALNDEHWDTLSLNFRSCSGEPNRLARSYHSGETEDITKIVDLAVTEHHYEFIHLIGFSLGGNVALKFVGEKGKQLPSACKSVIGISVPCELRDCSVQISKKGNKVYLNRFLKSLKEKVRLKSHLTKDVIDLQKVLQSKDFFEFDHFYTAPVHGFSSGEEYWRLSSANRVLDQIKIPCLIINALDDSFLADSCFPRELAQNHPYVHLETPKYGGHVGFTTFGQKGTFWSETRTIKFIKEVK